jgi:hypothetical protein
MFEGGILKAGKPQEQTSFAGWEGCLEEK